MSRPLNSLISGSSGSEIDDQRLLKNHTLDVHSRCVLSFLKFTSLGI